MRRYFVYDGVNSRDMGIWMQEHVSLSGAEPLVERVNVPGRNGDLHFSCDSFQNRTATVKCFVTEDCVDCALNQINCWVMRNGEYRRLEFPWEPDTYLMASVSAGAETAISARRLGKFTLSFDCKPQKFYKSGEIPVTMTETGELYNSGFPALPLITVYGSGSGSVTIGSNTVTLQSIDGYVILDCDVQNAYKGTENKNGTIRALEFPRLESGKNAVTWTGGVQRLEIIPRWWTI